MTMQIKERPILFSGAMVRALLDGSKTQTRRALRDQVCAPGIMQMAGPGYAEIINEYGVHIPGFSCPYGQPGDRLMVRETFFAYGRWVTRYSEKKRRDEWHFVDMTAECDRAYQYDASGPDLPLTPGRGGALPGWHRRPAIFMPRAASRILLEIVSVRVERLNACGQVDAIAEGAVSIRNHAWDREHFPAWRFLFDEAVAAGAKPPIGPTPLQAYQALWESINGAGSWDANPWVWVVEFKRVAP